MSLPPSLLTRDRAASSGSAAADGRIAVWQCGNTLTTLPQHSVQSLERQQDCPAPTCDLVLSVRVR